MTLDYLYADRQSLSLPGKSFKAKMLLGLIKNCNSQGLHVNNQELGNLLSCSPDYITKLLKEIAAYVRIENPQSRYRKIFYSGNSNGVDTNYSGDNNGVKPSYSEQDSGVNDSTPSLRPATPAKTTDIIKRIKRTTTTAKHKSPLCDIPPTVTQVKEYATTQGKPDFDAEYFIKWYSANDWKHKDGKPVLNWKQTVLTWLRRDKKTQVEKPEPKRGDLNWLPTEKELDEILAETPQGAA